MIDTYPLIGIIIGITAGVIYILSIMYFYFERGKRRL